MNPAPAGSYYPRIHRPAIEHLVEYGPLTTATTVVLRMLSYRLQSLLETIEPEPANFSTYGHSIRLQLISACTEVETSLSGVLQANSYPGDRWTTMDYVRLLDPMQLDTYSVYLPSYPHLPEFKPFLGWDAAQSTKSLPWYDAYNLTKHDREAHLNKATVLHAIHATGALLVVAAAQFGDQFALSAPGGDMLLALQCPNLRIDDYTLPVGNAAWTPVNYQF